MFKLGLNIDNIAEKPPGELAPGWDTAELPITELLLPYDGDAAWQKKKTEIQSWDMPPWCATSHWLWDERVSGDRQTDWSELERLAELSCRRMAEIGCPVAGVWGNFFEVGAAGQNRAMDDALRYCDMVAGYADRHGVLIALEPTAHPETVFPTYREGIDFVKRLQRNSVRLMADLNYFVEIGQALEDIALEPDYCLHVHVQGEQYQPNVGDCRDKILHLFRVLRDMDYRRTVSSAHPWTVTEGEVFNYGMESAKTLAFLQELRTEVYHS